MSGVERLAREHHTENDKGITNADKHRGQMFTRIASANRGNFKVLAAAWAEYQHHLLLIRGGGFKNRRHRQKDPDMWA